MEKTKNIFLVGPMGTGKTSVGKQLSQLTHRPFYDSDLEIEKRTGVTVTWIFQVEKEAGYRKREHEIIAELTSRQGIILSTGGGSVVTEENCQLLTERGIVVHLEVSLDIQFARTNQRQGTRPMLITDNPKETLQKLNQTREPLYQKIADLTYCTDDLHPRQIAKQILRDVKLLQK